MSTLARAIKEEIIRLARKEVRAQAEPLRKSSAGYRHQIAELKRTVAQLQRQVAVLGRAGPKTAQPTAEPKPTRFVAKGLRRLRERLGLTVEDLGALAGVSGQTIRNWEAKKSTPGKEHRAVLIGLRAFGKREAKARLLQIRAKVTKSPSDVAKKK
jgi:DNA-binding transcriptional regulator YiaG